MSDPSFRAAVEAKMAAPIPINDNLDDGLFFIE